MKQRQDKKQASQPEAAQARMIAMPIQAMNELLSALSEAPYKYAARAIDIIKRTAREVEAPANAAPQG